MTTLLEDADPAHLDWTEAAWRDDALGREHLDTAAGVRLKNVSNLAFGGPDMRTAWLGNLLGTRVPWLRVAVPGAEMPHYRVPLGPLGPLGPLDAFAAAARERGPGAARSDDDPTEDFSH